MALLRVRTPDGVRTVPLTDRPLTLGRAESCDIILRGDAEVSREHARIWLTPDGYVQVEDAGSKNGTRVDDGEAFRDTIQTARRTVHLGDNVLEIVIPEGESGAGVRFSGHEAEQLEHTRFFPSTRNVALSNQQRLGLLMGLTERIGGVFEKTQLLEQALDGCIEALGFERGMIALKSARGDAEQPIVRNVPRDETGAYKISRTLINRALVDGERAVVNNPATDLINNLSESLVRFPICSALCVPILHRDEILGVIYGDRVTRATTYTSDDVDFLAAIAQQIGTGLANLRLVDEHVRAQKVYAAIEQARGIQRRLLPAAPLQLGRVAIEGFNQPSASVSGDYYDYFPIHERQLGVVIADVTGHGLPAALIMANLQAAVRVALTADAPLADLSARLNRLVCANTGSDVFITAIIGRLDTEAGAFEYVSAGHPSPLILKTDGAFAPTDDEEFNSVPLGVIADETFRPRTLCCDDGCRGLLFYTDGMTEAEDAAGDMLGAGPVLRELGALKNPAPAAMLNCGLNVVRRHVGRDRAVLDDLTLLAVRFMDPR